MVTALAALGPVFLLVLMGFILKRAPFPGAGVWPAAGSAPLIKGGRRGKLS